MRLDRRTLIGLGAAGVAAVTALSAWGARPFDGAQEADGNPASKSTPSSAAPGPHAYDAEGFVILPQS